MIAQHRTHFIGIFIIALAILAYQILLTRLFSVMLYYHFAFAGISLAMLGLTMGAVRVYLHADRFSAQRLEEEWAKAALGFALSSIVAVLWFLYVPLIVPQEAIFKTLGFSFILFIVPFTYGGICITLILTKSPVSVGKLYCADLVGASLGCIGVVMALFVLDPVSVMLGLSVLSAFSAWVMVRRQTSQLSNAAAIVTAAALLAFLAQAGLYLTDSQHIRVMWAKSQKQENILFERWNAFSRVRVIPYPNREPFGWGFGHPQTARVEQHYLDIDADASTILTHFSGDVKSLSFLGNDIINMGYQIRPVKKVAVLGVGGGRDILSALYFGAQGITGIELNPAIFEALTRVFADFTGHLDQRPQVTLINAEARSWLNQTHNQFDLVQISLIDTWAATAAGGLTLSENKLYTVEAWREFLRSLSPQGILVVSRWFDPHLYKGEFYRLLSLAVASLEQQGVPASEVNQHILAFNVGHIITVAISPNPFSAAERNHAYRAAKQRGFNVLESADHSWDDISRTIASGNADKKFYAALPADITAPTDNRPFFFYMARMKDLLWSAHVPQDTINFYDTHATNSGNKPQTTNEMLNFYGNDAMLLVARLMLSMLVCVVVFVALPLASLSRQQAMRGILPYLGYFAGIGLGFMLLEISQMQRLMVFLGHPVYGLSVVLFTLLLFGGLGSATVDAQSDAGQLWLRPLLLCLVLCVIGVITPVVTEYFKMFGTPVRIMASVALLAPAGFCMGMMFPVGMRLSGRYRLLQPWFWGVNGVVSAFASVFAVVLSIQYGITAVYWIGVAFYVGCLVFAVRYARSAA